MALDMNVVMIEQADPVLQRVVSVLGIHQENYDITPNVQEI